MRYTPAACYPPGRRSRRCGFTLIELLAVVAIVAILAGVVLVALSRMRIAAEKPVCASNLRQIHAALNLFAAEYGAYPNYNSEPGEQPTGVWAKRLKEYVSLEDGFVYGGAEDGHSVFVCPARLRQFSDKVAAREASSYGINDSIAGVSTWNHTKPVSPMRITQPAKTILVADGVWSESGGYPFQEVQYVMLPGSIRDRTSGGSPTPGVHGDGAANIIFVDGHVEWFNDSHQLSHIKYRNGGPEDLWTIHK